MAITSNTPPSNAFRTYLCLMPLATVNKGTFIYLQSVGKALASTMISMVREVIFGVGFALLLLMWFGLDGVLYSMPVSDLFTFLIALAIILSTFRQLSESSVLLHPLNETVTNTVSGKGVDL